MNRIVILTISWLLMTKNFDLLNIFSAILLAFTINLILDFILEIKNKLKNFYYTANLLLFVFLIIVQIFGYIVIIFYPFARKYFILEKVKTNLLFDNKIQKQLFNLFVNVSAFYCKYNKDSLVCLVLKFDKLNNITNLLRIITKI